MRHKKSCYEASPAVQGQISHQNLNIKLHQKTTEGSIK